MRRSRRCLTEEFHNHMRDMEILADSINDHISRCREIIGLLDHNAQDTRNKLAQAECELDDIISGG